MADIAELGFKVDTKDLDAGTASLQKLSQIADNSGKSVEKLEQILEKLSKQQRRNTPEVDKHGKALNILTEGLNSVQGGAAAAAQGIAEVAGAASTGGLVMLGFTASIAAVTAALGKSVAVAEDWQRIGLRTEAILKATGNASGLTANEIRELSKSMEGLTDAQNVEAAAQKLLTFKSIAGETFKETLILANDLAANGFGAIEGNVVQLGKALENPIEGLSALSRVGVSFDPIQKDMIENFVKTNRLADAQKIILEALAGQVGGAAAAEGGGLAGAYDKLGDNVEEFLEHIGNSGPLSAMTTATNLLAESVGNLNKQFFQSNESKFNELFARRVELTELIKENEKNISAFGRERDRSLNRELKALDEKMNALRAIHQTELDDKALALEKAAAAAKEREENAKASKVIEERKKKEEEALKVAEQVANQRRQAVAAITQEAATLGMSENQIKLYELAMLGASKAQMQMASEALNNVSAFKQNRDIAQGYGKAMDQLIGIQTDADMSTRDLDASQKALMAIMSSPVWAQMPVAWQQYIITQSAATSETIKAVEAQTRLKQLLETAPSVAVNKQQEDMDLLNQAIESGGQSAIRAAEVKKMMQDEESMRLQSARDALFSGLLTEEEQLRLSYERRKAEILASTEITELERQDLLRRNQETFDSEEKARQQELISAQLLGYGEMFEGLSSLTKSFAGEQAGAYRALFAISKAFAIADATVKLHAAIMTAANAPPPLNFAQMAAVAAAGSSLISSIQSATLSFEGGGFTGSGPRTGGVDGKGGFIATLHPNETVIDHTRGQSAAAPQVNLRQINLFDSQVIEDYLGSDSGERIVMNTIRRNSSEVKQMSVS